MSEKNTLVTYRVVSEFADGSQFDFPCPECGEEIRFIAGEIEVNCFTKGIIETPNFFKLERKCKTPTCNWSKIKITESKHI